MDGRFNLTTPPFSNLKGDAVNEALSSSSWSSTDPSTANPQHRTIIFPTETLWVAAKSRRVSIYCLETTEKTELTHFVAPESVVVIKTLNDKVFFGQYVCVVVVVVVYTGQLKRPIVWRNHRYCCCPLVFFTVAVIVNNLGICCCFCFC